MRLYTKEDFLKAAKFCEVPMIDARYIIERIDEITDPIELPSDEEIIPVKALEEDSDWYLIPNELYEEFKNDTYNEEMVESGGFDDKWWKYKTGGDLNLIQLYVKIQGGNK